MDAVIGLLACVGGVALLAYSMLLRRGTRPGARDWVHYGEYRISLNMVTWPTAGAGMLAFGLIRWREDSALTAALAPILIVMAVALGLFNMLQVPVPVWFLPGWARGSVRGRRAAEKRARRRAAEEKRARRAAEKGRARR